MLSPEVLAEQVMGYAIGALELIPTLKPASHKTYSIAVLPQGPHFYTGLLQAAGYLLLDKQKKKLLIISQQSDDQKNILIDNQTYGPIFGQHWKNSHVLTKKIAQSIGAKFAFSGQKSLIEQMDNQLLFIRVITECKQLLHISIGNNISQDKIKKILSWIHQNREEYNIVVLTNIQLSKITTSTKKDEQHQLAKIIQASSLDTPLLTIFQKILDFDKRESELIAYVNPGDFGKTRSLATRYVCAVG